MNDEILTAREHQIARLVAAGMRNQAIADKLGLSIFTVKNMMRTIFDKSGMSSRLELALWYLHHFLPSASS